MPRNSLYSGGVSLQRKMDYHEYTSYDKDYVFSDFPVRQDL